VLHVVCSSCPNANDSMWPVPWFTIASSLPPLPQEFVPQCLLGVLHRGELADPEVVSYARQTAAALDYLHSQDVIHCDLAARNISSDTVFVSLFDCSLCAPMHGRGEYSRCIHLLGTPCFTVDMCVVVVS